MNSHNRSRKTSTPILKSTRLLDQLREQIRHLHYSLRTEEAYVYWGQEVHAAGPQALRDAGAPDRAGVPGVADTRTPEQGGDPQFWYGLRPATPTNIPLIGRLLAAEESLDQRRPRHIGVDAPRARARRWPN